MEKNELRMELNSLASEHRMGQAAIKAHQNSLSAMLNGSMGRDIHDVLSGRKQVKLTWKQKMKYKIDNFLKLFNNTDEYGI
jgi:hypothetical protein